MQVGGVDLAIVVVYLAGILGFGVWVGWKQRGIKDYLLGNRDLPWWAVLLSIVATESSIVTFLSVPGVVYRIPTNPNSGNLQFLQLPLGYIIGRYIVVWLLLPAYFRGDLYTAYEVLDKRFGGNTKRVASLLFVVARNLADGLRLYLAGFFLAQAFHVDLDWTIVAVGAATLVYTYFGGVKAVIWTECAQFAIKLAGAIIAGVIVLKAVGGWQVVYEFGRNNGSLAIFDFGFSLTKPYTFWAGVVGGTFLSLATHGVDQMMVQRYLCAGSLKHAGRALAASGWVILFQFALTLLLGLALACYFNLNPPEPPFQNNDEVFTRFLASSQLLPVGLLGLVLAAVLSAAMSTLSSSLNASAGTITTDWLAPLFGWSKDSSATLRSAKLLTIGFGIVQTTVAIVGSRLTTSVVTDVLAIAGFTTGIVLGLFFLGVFTRVKEGSALGALVLVLAAMIALKYTTKLAWPWYPLIGSVGMLAVGSLLDFFLPARQGVADATVDAG